MFKEVVEQKKRLEGRSRLSGLCYVADDEGVEAAYGVQLWSYCWTMLLMTVELKRHVVSRVDV